MKLDIRLFAGLKCLNPELSCYEQEEFCLEVPVGTKVGQLRQLLNLKSKYPLVNMVNGLAQNDDWVLAEDDRVGIFPPVGGG